MKKAMIPVVVALLAVTAAARAPAARVEELVSGSVAGADRRARAHDRQRLHARLRVCPRLDEPASVATAGIGFDLGVSARISQRFSIGVVGQYYDLIENGSLVTVNTRPSTGSRPELRSPITSLPR